ncbi:MAG: DUF418 domain-containing protein [Sphingomicrobium sp.]
MDALRGLALFGILLANILVFSGWVFPPPDHRVALAGVDGALWQERLHHFFVDGKFYTIFSMLFGAGFALQLQRLTNRGVDGLRIYRRRILILLAIGLVHEWLIWDGDILVLYALLGLVLPFFHRLADRVLLVTAAVLIFVVPFAGIALVKAMNWPPDLGFFALSDRVAIALGGTPADPIAWISRPDFQARFSWIASGPIYAWGLKLMSWRIPKVLGIMLVGVWLGRRLADGRLPGNRVFLWRVLAIGLSIGVPANIFYARTAGLGQSDWPSLIGTVPMAFAYAAGFALAWPHAQRWLGVLAAPGRMALTNYLAQSVICVVVFYGFALGQVGKWPPPGLYGFAVLLFAAQTAFSHRWLARHTRGPMEFLWRRWTYAGVQRMTAASAPA